MSSAIFQKLEPISKKARVVASVKEAIINGSVQAGEPIVEAKIAQQFGVGQGLIREALIELEHQGFVQRTPFSGTHVQTLTLHDAQQIFDLRIELEPLAIYLAGSTANDRDIKELNELADKTRIASKARDLDGFFESHLSFRKQIWKLS